MRKREKEGLRKMKLTLCFILIISFYFLLTSTQQIDQRSTTPSTRRVSTTRRYANGTDPRRNFNRARNTRRQQRIRRASKIVCNFVLNGRWLSYPNALRQQVRIQRNRILRMKLEDRNRYCLQFKGIPTTTTKRPRVTTTRLFTTRRPIPPFIFTTRIPIFLPTPSPTSRNIFNVTFFPPLSTTSSIFTPLSSTSVNFPTPSTTTPSTSTSTSTTQVPQLRPIFPVFLQTTPSPITTISTTPVTISTTRSTVPSTSNPTTISTSLTTSTSTTTIAPSSDDYYYSGSGSAYYSGSGSAYYSSTGSLTAPVNAQQSNRLMRPANDIAMRSFKAKNGDIIIKWTPGGGGSKLKTIST